MRCFLNNAKMFTDLNSTALGTHFIKGLKNKCAEEEVKQLTKNKDFVISLLYISSVSYLSLVFMGPFLSLLWAITGVMSKSSWGSPISQSIQCLLECPRTISIHLGHWIPTAWMYLVCSADTFFLWDKEAGWELNRHKKKLAIWCLYKKN